MAPSDLVGGIGGLLLAVPPLKDQYYRYNQFNQERRKQRSPWPELREQLVQAWAERRAGYNGWDTAMIAIGSIAIVVAFALKAFNA